MWGLSFSFARREVQESSVHSCGDRKTPEVVSTAKLKGWRKGRKRFRPLLAFFCSCRWWGATGWDTSSSSPLPDRTHACTYSLSDSLSVSFYSITQAWTQTYSSLCRHIGSMTFYSIWIFKPVRIPYLIHFAFNFCKQLKLKKITETQRFKWDLLLNRHKTAHICSLSKLQPENEMSIRRYEMIDYICVWHMK